MSEQTIVIIGLVWTGAFSTGSAVFQMLGMVGLSKICGTLFALDIGRVIRWCQSRTPAARQAQQTAKIREAVGKADEWRP